MNTDQLDAMRAVILSITKDLGDTIAKHPNQPIYQHVGEAILRHDKRVRVIITVCDIDDSQPVLDHRPQHASQDADDGR